MAARFLYLQNAGSPTRWNVERYFRYLQDARPVLPPELQDMTADDRYELPSMSSRSMWHASITQIEARAKELFVAARSEGGLRRFEFSYSGVCKVQATLQRVRAMPSIVVQELVRLPNGIYRHSFSTLGGDVSTIYARSIGFSDRPLQ
jgi:hypothetical protein